MRTWLRLAALTLTLGVPLSAAETTLRAGFTQGLDATQARGAGTATPTGTVNRLPDRHGTAVVLGPGRGSVAWPLARNLDLAAGSATAWVQPSELTSTGQPLVPILRARQGAAGLAVAWRAADRALVATWQPPTGPGRTLTKPAYDWGQPTWRHLVLTWGLAGLALYVDGQAGLTGAAAPLPESPDGQLVLGGELGGKTTLAVRSLTILDAPLTAEQAADRYRVAVSGQVPDERPALSVPLGAAAPKIDGTLDDACWQTAGGTSGFVALGGGQLSTVATQALACADGTNLYLAFRCPTPLPATAAKVARDGGAPWDDDCIELYLQPEVGFTATVFHLALNAAGSLWDAQDQNAGWNMGGTWAVAPGADAWTAEVAIPYASLGTIAPTPNTTWQANLCRSIGGGATGNRHTEWAATGTVYGTWQRFGALRFTPGPVARITRLAATTPQPGATVGLRLANPSAQPAKLSLVATAYHAGQPDETTEVVGGPWELAPGAGRDETVTLSAPVPIDQVRVLVRDGAGAVVLSQMVRYGAVAPVSATPSAPAGTVAAAPTPQLTDAQLANAVRERAVWEHNTLGLTEQVPPPWTPMSAAGTKVNCWGRTYDYAGSLLPSQVRAQDADLLAAPIRLVARVGGKDVPLQAGTPKLMPAANHVDVDGRATAAGITAHAFSHLEYDGCAKVELTLAPGATPVTLDGLELEIPVRADRALYYHWFEATRDPRLTNAGALPADGLTGHFKPLLWLGDDDRGFCWFAESPKGWQLSDKEHVLRVERRGATTVMRIRMMDRPYVLVGPWQTTFGLMATPVRPMPPGWRDWLIPVNQTNPWGSWSPGFNNLSGTDDPGTLSPKDPAAMKRWVDEQHREGGSAPFLPLREPAKVIPYSQIVFWSGKLRDGTPSPEITLWGPEWSYREQPPGPRQTPPEQIPPKDYYWVCPQSSFSQFYLYKLNQLIDQTGIDGIYIDGPWNTCGNPLHGCGYRDDQGQWQIEYKIWPFRELLKRIYCLFWSKGRDFIVHQHTSCWLSIPCLSFAHMELDGEQYHDAGQKVEDHFMDVVPLDKWRAEHTMRQWGPAPFLLPDIPGRWTAGEAATRELLMLTNLHDTGLFPAGNNWRVVMRNYQARRLFGVARCDFHGYWGNQSLVRSETKDVLVSVYRQHDGSRCLLVVGNTAKADAAATVRPNPAGLKLTGAIDAGVDLETGERLPLKDGALNVPVKARDYRLIALPFYTPPPITAGDLRAQAGDTVPNPGFEQGLSGWAPQKVEGNDGTIEPDTTVKASGTASAHLHKVEGPGGVMLQAEQNVRVEPGRKYRVNCKLRIANAKGPGAYWMLAPLDAEGVPTVNNNLFSVALHKDQDWTPYPFEFTAPPGTVVMRVCFLVAFPGSADAWIDDLTFEPLP